MVDRNRTIKYSNVRIKMNIKNETVAVTTYPNPLTSELRITILQTGRTHPYVVRLIAVQNQQCR
jgi:hypothetical protein